MRSRAYDTKEVVHLTPHKGAMQPSCYVPDEGDEPDPLILSPMFLSSDTPVTCVKCIAIEVQLVQEETSEEPDE